MTRTLTLVELARLSWQRPGPQADAEAVAAWYEAKAATHEHLAVEAAGSGDELGAAREYGYARTAAAHAASLRGEGVAA